MKNVLQINTSLNAGTGLSTQLASELVFRLLEQHPVADVAVRDLALDPVPHLTDERFAAFTARPEARTPEQQSVVAYSDALIGELRLADTIVIGLPMYNFSVPSTLKAYFDHVARAGVTFRYSETGPIGLLTGKKAYIVATRGGRVAGTPMDTEIQYVQTFLGFLGITDVEFILAEGLALGEAPREAGIAQARQTIARRFTPTREPLAA